MDTRPSSYLNITAAEASEGAVSYAGIQQAVKDRNKTTLMKLVWVASVGTVLYSQQLDSLENTRQYLKKQVDSFSLAFAEVQKTSPKNMSEEQLLQRTDTLKEIAETLKKTQILLESINQEIIYLNDYKEDRQSRFRQKMAEYNQQLDQIIEEKIDGVIKLLKEKGMNFPKSEAEMRAVLKEAFHNPELQEAYIKATGQIQGQSLKDKLKGWFSS